MTAPVRWRKSSRSGQEGNCVELAHTLVGVRDTKNPDGPCLHNVSVRQLLLAVRCGLLDG